jgi:hypothetical protein
MKNFRHPSEREFASPCGVWSTGRFSLAAATRRFGGGSSESSASTATTDNRTGAADQGVIAQGGSTVTYEINQNDPAAVAAALNAISENLTTQAESQLGAISAMTQAGASVSNTAIGGNVQSAGNALAANAAVTGQAIDLVAQATQDAIAGVTSSANTAAGVAQSANNNVSNLAARTLGTAEELTSTVLANDRAALGSVLDFFAIERETSSGTLNSLAQQQADLTNKTLGSLTALSANTASGGQTDFNKTILYVVIALAAAIALPSLLKRAN